MRLIVIDDDSHYIKAVQSVISMTHEGQTHISNLEFYGLATIETLNTLDRSILASGLICLPIKMMDEMTDWLMKYKETGQVNIDSSINPLILFHHEGVLEPKLKEKVLESSYWKDLAKENGVDLIGHDSLFIRKADVDYLFISKYQKLGDWLKSIHASYLHLATQDIIGGKQDTRLISVFAPMVKGDQSQRLLDKVIARSGNKRRLILFFDPYFGSPKNSVNYRQTLSYFFTLIKRKSNVNFLIKHMSYSVSDNLDVIYGPMNMKDMEVLDKDQVQRFIKWLKELNIYDEIILHFAGVHINDLVHELLTVSNERILISQEEKVQETVTKTYKLPWILADRQEYRLLSEVLT